MRTNAHFGAATVDWATTRSNVESLWKGWGARVGVHTGFIGSSADGRTTTLGRNGSDYTATFPPRRGSQGQDCHYQHRCPWRHDSRPKNCGWREASLASQLSRSPGACHLRSKVVPRADFFPLIQTNVPMLIRNTCAKDLHAGTLISSMKSTDTETAQAPPWVVLRASLVRKLCHDRSASHAPGRVT